MPFGCESVDLRESTQVEIVGIEALTRLPARPLDFGLTQLGLDCTDYPARHMVLKLEYVFQRTVEAIGPDMRAGTGVYKLTGDAHPMARFPHRTFEHVAHAQFARHLFHIDGFALYVRLCPCT